MVVAFILEGRRMDLTLLYRKSEWLTHREGDGAVEKAETGVVFKTLQSIAHKDISS